MSNDKIITNLDFQFNTILRYQPRNFYINQGKESYRLHLKRLQRINLFITLDSVLDATETITRFESYCFFDIKNYIAWLEQALMNKNFDLYVENFFWKKKLIYRICTIESDKVTNFKCLDKIKNIIIFQ